MPFIDIRSEDGNVTNTLLPPLPTGHLVVRSVFEDGIRVSVIEPSGRQIIEVPATPISSPDSRFFVAADEDALADDILSIWRLDPAIGWIREYVTTNGHRAWAPRQVTWRDDSTVVYVRDFFNQADSTIVLARRARRWAELR
ncbi:MAG TPA: hypothetical protein VNL98_12105 [Gemmatimonadales bacterium]|nr:hypothetical protein [Gemmatimonadales bacterium]